MWSIKKIEKCRSCDSKELIPIISLGDQYIVNFVSSVNDKRDKCPLNLVLCDKCKLLQLEHNAPNSSMWNEQYWYKSAINKMIRENLKEIVSEANNLVDLNLGDVVVDIGCNDGTLLEYYSNEKSRRIGFEPSKNVCNEARKKGLEVINDFFSAEEFDKILDNQRAKIITAISMFYDLEDPNKFLRDIVKILDKEGLFIVQQNYLVSMLEQNAFDNICHEHREYYSLTSFIPLLEKHGLEIVKASLNDINGGSIRTIIKFKDSNKDKFSQQDKEFIDDLLAKEKELLLDEKEPYIEFATRIETIKKDLLNFLREEKLEGKKICAIGASTRGEVLLQYFELGPDIIDCIFDKNPDKEGKKTGGTLIPITSPKKIEKYKPDYQIVLIWHIFKGLEEDELKFLNEGGKFILPLPKLKIIASYSQI